MKKRFQMYKVFVNNRPLTIANERNNAQRNIPFQHKSDFHVAVDLLCHLTESVHIYGKNPDEIWDLFQQEFKQIFAAGGLVLNDANEMLWIYRLGKWDLPKGKMEKNEKTEETAIREVEEECGISGLKIAKPLKTTYHMYFHKEYILKVTYWFEMKYSGNEALIPQTEEGISEVKWLNINNLEFVSDNTYANIRELIQPYLV